jgi:hypothetical protein
MLCRHHGNRRRGLTGPAPAVAGRGANFSITLRRMAEPAEIAAIAVFAALPHRQLSHRAVIATDGASSPIVV